ncbi:MAG: host-nuclease inhibitor Gam family protein [Verrucomicrobiota bacterium]
MKESADSFGNLVALLAVYSEASIRLSELQSAADTQLLETVDEQRPDYVQAQTALESAEAAIKKLAEAHPEWLNGRAIRTPYGTVKFTKATVLEVANPEASLTLIKAVYRKDADAYIRVSEELNLETLETLSDDDLNRIGILRLTKDSISIKPAKVDMGKAAKKAEIQEAA